ncbi:DUF5808 domain-containing protein [Paenibacillus sinopodophylli]|uniref:DUF5808 domain-containing protein n=1 Tax=Paenibacillus sinopodophylli TaxID=1837342 RepID=UPI00110CC406|nr:DUF5808 domain-containing protein [Paenibacillus sinopodophylli]
MSNLYLIITVFIVYITIIVMYVKQAVPSNQILFGVTFPKQGLKDPRIKQLQTDYKKNYTVYAVITLITLAPFFVLDRYFSLSLIYLFVWIAAFLYTSKLPFNRIHHKAARMKRENAWFVGETRTIRIDAKITQLKKSRLVSPYWFIIPALLSITPIFISLSNHDILLRMSGVASLAMSVILYVIFAAFGHMKTKIYSENHDINAAINRAARRYWSILWPAMAVFESINALVAYLILSNGSTLTFTQWMIGIIMVSLIPLGSIFFVHNKVRELEEHLADTNGEAILTDDDGYWINGSTYYNPEDPSVMVPKRIGMGSTVNMAARGGKWLQYGSIALALLIILPLAAFAVQSDQTVPTITISDSGVVAIDYPLYDYSFNLSDVQSITLEKELPSGFRTNGTATAEYARGNFSLEKVGTTKLYVFKNKPPYIVIQLDGLAVIFNDKEAAKTEALFNELKGKLPQ